MATNIYSEILTNYILVSKDAATWLRLPCCIQQLSNNENNALLVLVLFAELSVLLTLLLLIFFVSNVHGLSEVIRGRGDNRGLVAVQLFGYSNQA